MKILLIGPYPPPYGGISVHIERLYQYFTETGNVCKILNTGNKNYGITNNDIIGILDIFKLFRFNKKNPIVHIHVSALSNLIKIYLLSYLFNKQNKIITIHSGTFTKRFKDQSKLKNVALGMVLRNFDQIITVNNEQKEFINCNTKIDKKNITVIPAFINPTVTSANIMEKDISQIQGINKIKIVMSGYLQDIYGYELVIDFLKVNKEYFGLFIFYGTADKTYKRTILNQIDKLKNAKYFFNLLPSEFNWLLKNSDIYVRNTDRDGDSVAIREAMFWGIAVCASDAVSRPSSTKLFEFNDKYSFEKAITEIISNGKQDKFIQVSNYAEDINRLYSSLGNK